MIPITDRYKFPLYDRGSFKAAAGFEAPAFNPAWPVKQWFDPAPPANPVYQVWDGSVTDPKLKDLPLPVAEAGTVNLPGHPDYPAYVPAPTPATFVNHFGLFVSAPRPMIASDLSTKAQADALAALVGATVVQNSALNQFIRVTWGSEARRDYILQYKGQGSGPTVGSLLVSMNANGVGAPGHWDAAQIAAGHLQWVAEVMDDGSGNHPVLDIPLALLPDEELYSLPVGGIGFATVAVRKIGTPAPPSGGGDTALALDTNKTLHAIAKAMQLE